MKTSRAVLLPQTVNIFQGIHEIHSFVAAVAAGAPIGAAVPVAAVGIYFSSFPAVGWLATLYLV